MVVAVGLQVKESASVLGLGLRSFVALMGGRTSAAGGTGLRREVESESEAWRRVWLQGGWRAAWQAAWRASRDEPSASAGASAERSKAGGRSAKAALTNEYFRDLLALDWEASSEGLFRALAPPEGVPEGSASLHR